MKSAYLGGGCFWCLEAQYKLLPGVQQAVSGYAGGKVVNPSYEQVCSGNTGHAEIVRIDYDPTRVSYETLLDKFWITHDPTTLNRQGHDIGTQYRSVILYTNPEEKRAAEASIASAQKNFPDPIVTELSPLDLFYPAEACHQDYYTNNPTAGYCHFVVRPKVEKFARSLDS